MKRLEDKINGNPNDPVQRDTMLQEESGERGAGGESGEEERAGYVFEQSYD